MSTSHGPAPDRRDSTTGHLTENDPDVSRRRVAADRDDLVRAQDAAHGGIKWGAAFFGWLTAMGAALLLTALVAAIGAAVGLANQTDLGSAATDAANQAGTVGWVGAIALLVVLFVAYYCGGYVAGRMARFQGARQGLAVWLWAVVIAIALAALSLIAGSKYNVLSQLNSFPRIPVDEGTLTTTGIVALLVTLAASLAGAVLGGKAGMRYHRKVDHTLPAA